MRSLCTSVSFNDEKDVVCSKNNKRMILVKYQKIDFKTKRIWREKYKRRIFEKNVKEFGNKWIKWKKICVKN